MLELSPSQISKNLQTEPLLERNRGSEDGEVEHRQDQGFAGIIHVVKAKLRTRVQNSKLLLKASRNFKLSLLAHLAPVHLGKIWMDVYTGESSQKDF